MIAGTCAQPESVGALQDNGVVVLPRRHLGILKKKPSSVPPNILLHPRRPVSSLPLGKAKITEGLVNGPMIAHRPPLEHRPSAEAELHGAFEGEFPADVLPDTHRSMLP